MISHTFPKYTEYGPLVPVWCVTPNIDGCIHRFFDTSPFSPSGRFLAVTRFPQEQTLPQPGEEAEIILVDLKTGHTTCAAKTCGWETQMGANINWGPDDETLYFNNVEPTNWEPFIVKLNPQTGEKSKLEGSIYRISPNGKYIISSCAKRMRRTQNGYGVIVPDIEVPRNKGLRDDDGLYITDTDTGKQKLLVSIKDVFERALPKIEQSYYEEGECYGFHCKFNPQGDRLLFTMRWFEGGKKDPWNMLKRGLDYFVVTMKPDGSDMRVAVGPEQWQKRGHHINWFPDGKRLSMNLCIDDDQKMYLTEVNDDGTDLKKIIGNLSGSGHPTVHPNGKYILTDAYKHESVANGDGTVPLRWINLEAKKEERIITVNVENSGTNVSSALRVDPHPAWDLTHRFIAFNGFVGGTRRVFVADLGELVKE